ncbi:MAG: V4R domain-containing protein [Candidatus Methanomethyliaceae archaeon]
MPRPLNLSRYLVCPDRCLVGIMAKVKASSEMISELFARATKHNITVQHFSMTPLERTEEASALIFLDMTDSKVDAERFFKDLQQAGLIEVFEIIRSPVKGFIADTATHPLLAGSTRAVILRETGYRELLVGIREFFGASGETFLYHIGFRFGLGLAELHNELAEKVGLKDPVRIYKHISAALFQWAGFGRIEVRELNHECGTILVYDSFECELGKYRAIPYSQFVRGIIAGTLSRLFGKRFNVVEEGCIAKRDPACKFVIKAITQKA